MTAQAQQFLEQKLRETLGECAVPALAAALVRDAGGTIVSAQQGVRKLGASGALNAIVSNDKFNLGSISKVFTGHLMGKLIQEGVGQLQWTTRISDVYSEFWALPVARQGYKVVTIEQLLTHTSGLPYTPANDDVNDWKNYTALDMTKPKLKARRRTYSQVAMIDKPSYWPPTSGFEYSGGGIIATSMAEKKTGKTYEDLVTQYIFTPLGMSNSGFGVMSTGALNGPWQHKWHADSFTTTPDADTHLPAFSWHCRTPVGGVCCSAADMGKFMREQLRPDPQVFSVAMRSTMQTHAVSTHSDFVRGAWASTQPGSSTAEIWHNGDNGVSYAHMSVRPAQGVGYAAMSNMSSVISSTAVHEMHEVMGAMHAHWSDLFGTAGTSFVECVHPMPAVTMAGQSMMLFARRHDGKVTRQRSSDGGASWSTAGDFGAVRVNSGLAAAASSDGKRLYVMGRGLDQRIWFGASSNGGTSWQAWNPIGAGVFLTGPAVATDASGNIVHVFGIGNDHRMWRARSLDAGKTWVGWEPIGQGVFTSAPAAATSVDGKIVHVFARGNDMRIWRNVSIHSGAAFEAHWSPIGKGIFTSGPAVTASNNGATVHVLGRGTDRQMWRNTSTNSGSSWLAHWQAMVNGTFTSAPALVSNATASSVQAYAFGGDFRVYGNRSTNSGQTWAGWAQHGTDYFL